MSLKETENFHESRFFGISQTVPKIYKQHEILLILTVYSILLLDYFLLIVKSRGQNWQGCVYSINADKDKERRRKKY